MNTVSEIFRSLAEIGALLISLAVLAVILQSPNTGSVIQSAAGGFAEDLAQAENIGGGTGLGHFGIGSSGMGG